MTGYQLHVRTFTLHTVLKVVSDSYLPPNPPSVDVRPATPASAPPSSSPTGVTAISAVTAADATNRNVSGGDGARAMDACGDEEGRVEVVEKERRAVREVAPAVLSSLVRPHFDACIAEVVELMMDDLFGESASAKEAKEVRAED